MNQLKMEHARCIANCLELVNSMIFTMPIMKNPLPEEITEELIKECLASIYGENQK